MLFQGLDVSHRSQFWWGHLSGGGLPSSRTRPAPPSQMTCAPSAGSPGRNGSSHPAPRTQGCGSARTLPCCLCPQTWTQEPGNAWQDGLLTCTVSLNHQKRSHLESGSTSGSHRFWRWEWRSSSQLVSPVHWHAPRAQSQSTESPEAWGWEEHPCRVHQSLYLWRSQGWRGRCLGYDSLFPRVSSWDWAHSLQRLCTGAGTHRSLGSAACWCGQWCPHCFLESALASQSPDWWQWFCHLWRLQQCHRTSRRNGCWHECRWILLCRKCWWEKGPSLQPDPLGCSPQ